MLLVAALLGLLCVPGLAQDPDDLLAIEQLADKNFINRYEYPYYFLPGRFGRQATVEEDMEAKTLPVMQTPVLLSNPIVGIINNANKFYRMIRNPEIVVKRPSRQYLLA